MSTKEELLEEYKDIKSYGACIYCGKQDLELEQRPYKIQGNMWLMGWELPLDHKCKQICSILASRHKE